MVTLRPVARAVLGQQGPEVGLRPGTAGAPSTGPSAGESILYYAGAAGCFTQAQGARRGEPCLFLPQPWCAHPH